MAEEQSTAIKAMMELLDLNLEMNKEKIVQEAIVIILDFIINFDDFKETVKQKIKQTKT